MRRTYDDETLEHCDLENVLSLIPQSSRKHISVNLQRVWQTYKYDGAEYEKRIYWHKMSEQLGYRPCFVSNAFTVNCGLKCYVDKLYHAEINYDGKVFKCTSRGYTDQNVKGVLKDDGEIKWNQELLARQYGKATFENKMCLACKHLPICNGPCSQNIMETSPDNLQSVCALKRSEVKPESFIIDLYEQNMKRLKEESEQQ